MIHNYYADKENDNNVNATSTIVHDDVTTNYSASTSTIFNNNLDDACVTNSSRTIWLESTHNKIELCLLSSS